MTYTELVTAIQSYTENQFPLVTLADGSTVSSTTQINRIIEQAEQRIYNSVQFPSLRKNQTGLVSTSTPYLSAPADFLATYSFAVIGADGSYTYMLNKDVNFLREAYPSPSTTGVPKYYALFGPTVSGTTITNELSFMLAPKPDAAYTVELHYYYYPESIVQAALQTLGTITGGAGYSAGYYFNVPLVGGSGSGATANIVISGGAVTSVTIANSGAFYAVGDSLTVSAADVGGSGAGLVIPVTAVSNATGTTWLGDNFDTVLLYGCLVEAYTYMKGEQDLVALYDGKYKEALALAKRLGDGMERQDAYRSGQYRQAVT